MGGFDTRKRLIIERHDYLQALKKQLIKCRKIFLRTDSSFYDKLNAKLAEQIKVAGTLIDKIFEVDKNLSEFRQEIIGIDGYHPSKVFLNEHFPPVSEKFDRLLIYIFGSDIVNELRYLRIHHFILKNAFDIKSKNEEDGQDYIKKDLLSLSGPRYMIVGNDYRTHLQISYSFKFTRADKNNCYDVEFNNNDKKYPDYYFDQDNVKEDKAFRNPMQLIIALNMAFKYGFDKIRLFYKPVRHEWLNALFSEHEKILRLMCDVVNFEKGKLVLRPLGICVMNEIIYTPSLALNIDTGSLSMLDYRIPINLENYIMHERRKRLFIEVMDKAYDELLFKQTNPALESVDSYFNNAGIPIFVVRRIKEKVKNEVSDYRKQRNKSDPISESEKERKAFLLYYSMFVCNLIKTLNSDNINDIYLVRAVNEIINDFVYSMAKTKQFSNIAFDNEVLKVLNEKYKEFEFYKFIDGDYSFIVRNKLIYLLPFYVKNADSYIDFYEIRDIFKESKIGFFTKLNIMSNIAASFLDRLIEEKKSLYDNRSFLNYLNELNKLFEAEGLYARNDIKEPIISSLIKYGQRSIKSYVELLHIIRTEKLIAFYANDNLRNFILNIQVSKDKKERLSIKTLFSAPASFIRILSMKIVKPILLKIFKKYIDELEIMRLKNNEIGY